MKDYIPMWNLKQQADPAVLDLYIYGDVQAKVWEGSWWDGKSVDAETSAKYFRQALEEHRDAQQINIYINSYGGSVFEGTAIYNQLRRHSAHKTVYIDGFACSVASVIAMAGDEIIMPRNTMMMIHNMWMDAVGNAAELRKAADDLDAINAAGRQAYLVKAGEKLTEEKLVEMMDSETWLSAQECLDYGLADRFAEQDADLTAAAGILQQANLNVQQRIDLQKSLCAQLREMTQRAPADGGEPTPEPEPAVKPEPIQNTILKLFTKI